MKYDGFNPALCRFPQLLILLTLRSQSFEAYDQNCIKKMSLLAILSTVTNGPVFI